MLNTVAAQALDHYAGVYAELEAAFVRYEAGLISISGYIDTVTDLALTVRNDRALSLRLCDWSLVLRPVNRAERAAWHETLAALAWCRDWAIQQRGAEVAACLASADYRFAQARSLAA